MGVLRCDWMGGKRWAAELDSEEGEEGPNSQIYGYRGTGEYSEFVHENCGPLRTTAGVSIVQIVESTTPVTTLFVIV